MQENRAYQFFRLLKKLNEGIEPRSPTMKQIIFFIGCFIRRLHNKLIKKNRVYGCWQRGAVRAWHSLDFRIWYR